MKTKNYAPCLQCGILLLVTSSVVGCKPETSTSTSTINSVAPVESTSHELDFDALLVQLDDAIGKRFQAMQMDGMNSASYQYTGPIKTVVEIIEPMALGAGFTEEKNGPAVGMDDAAKEMHKMGFNMKTIDQKMYTHANGDTLMIARADMSNNEMDMKLLTVQLLKMSAFGEPSNVGVGR